MFRKFVPQKWSLKRDLLHTSIRQTFLRLSVQNLVDAQIPTQPDQPDFQNMLDNISEVYRLNPHNFLNKKTIREIFDLTTQWHLSMKNNLQNPNHLVQIETQKKLYIKRLKAFLYTLHYEGNLHSILLLFRVLYYSGANDPSIFNLLLLSFLHKDGLQNLEVLSEFLDLWFSVLKTQITQAKAGTASSKFDLRKMFEDANFEAYIEQLLKVTPNSSPKSSR